MRVGGRWALKRSSFLALSKLEIRVSHNDKCSWHVGWWFVAVGCVEAKHEDKIPLYMPASAITIINTPRLNDTGVSWGTNSWRSMINDL